VYDTGLFLQNTEDDDTEENLESVMLPQSEDSCHRQYTGYWGGRAEKKSEERAEKKSEERAEKKSEEKTRHILSSLSCSRA
jgi:hypothetical protein